VIGIFDSGSGGLSVLRALVSRFPEQAFVYLGDHANAPYGDLPSREIVALTERGVAQLFALGARLVVLGCTHFAIVEPLFRHELPARTRLLSQPDAVADSLEDYLVRHPAYAEAGAPAGVRLLTTGAVAEASHTAAVFWPGAPPLERL
jgi:glutamate racemase